jgi:hypothetical protein
MSELPTKSTITSITTTPTANTEPTITAKFIGDTIVAGGPTLCNYSRGLISNTAVEFANFSRDHSCDVIQKIKLKQSYKIGFIRKIIIAAREGIETILKALSPSTIPTWMKAFAKWLAEKIKFLNKMIKDLIEVIDVIKTYVEFAAEMVTWILSLPAHLIELLSTCLKQFLGGIASAISDEFGNIGGNIISAEEMSSITELVSTAKETLSLGQQAITTAVSASTTATNTASSATQFVLPKYKPAI